MVGRVSCVLGFERLGARRRDVALYPGAVDANRASGALIRRDLAGRLTARLCAVHTPARIRPAVPYSTDMPCHTSYLVHVLVRLSCDEHVQLVVLARLGPARGVAPRAALLDAALAPDGDLGVGLALHALLRVATRPNDEPDEVEGGVLLLRGGR